MPKKKKNICAVKQHLFKVSTIVEFQQNYEALRLMKKERKFLNNQMSILILYSF